MQVDRNDLDLEGAGTPEEPARPSKSQLKRDQQAIQALAERLVSHPRAELERLHLSESLWMAFDELARIKDLRARRRQIKRIAVLLEGEDLGAIRALVEDQESLRRAESARLHRLERWRERLLAEGDRALSELIAHWPELDRQELRALIRAAQRDRERGKGDGSRKLFRFLRERLPEPMP
ncbi:DUF615 domain-containing protein [Caldichromatium japonicum]|uniref:Dual-action ribosomal maturation protein DarP n=2 Tax=Caldichromatium japonicum TaxID=2699430 RepID=A0A6G7VH09_9GAMM|nr:DUF615 domain-containing protein [Caldichromatium japonicum]